MNIPRERRVRTHEPEVRARREEVATMKAIKLAPIAMILAVVLGTVPAAAEHPSRSRGDAGLERLSHGLARAAGELRDEFARSRHIGWFQKRAAQRSLDRLQHDAVVFHRSVARKGAVGRDTRRAFRQLEYSFHFASERVPARVRRGVRHDLARVAELMEKVGTRMARIDDRRDHRRYGGLQSGGAGHVHDDGWRVAVRFDH
jgi:hypothetical protein